MTTEPIKFDAAEVSGSGSDGYFQVTLDSREESEELDTSFKDTDWDAPYLLLQRSFPEDDEEEECLYVETHRPEVSGHVRSLEVTMMADTFHASWDLGSATIRLPAADEEFPVFLRVLRIIAPGGKVTRGISGNTE